MDKPRTQYTKLKVITGYILFFLLAVVSIIFIYEQITGLAIDDRDSSSVNRKLLFIGNTITSLYEAESLSSSFIQTGSQETFNKYLDIIKQVEENIDSLKRLTEDPEQQLRIDTIQILLDEKVNNLEQLIRIKQPPVEDFYIQGINFLESQRDSTPNNAFVIKRVITTRDSTYVPQETTERRGFLDLFKTRKIDSTLHVTVSEEVMYDTITPSVVENYADTMLDAFKNIWENIWENYITETENYRQRITQQEYNIVNQSVHITEQLKQVLNQFEAEEITNSVNFLTERQDVISNTINLIAKIAIVAFIVLILFSFLTLKDISRGQKYRKELEVANQYTDQLLESKEKLILTVTHDIKTPLNSIMGYIELLNDSSVNERQNYYLKNMKGSSEHIMKLVQNLLDFSKLEGNKISAEKINFNPAHLINEIFNSFLPQTQSKNLELLYEVADNLNGNFQGDALRIRQIITNITSNAVKYTPKGSIKIKAKFLEEKRILKVEIKDSGVGMTYEEQKTVFKEFSRLPSTSHIEGTGLGLTITQKLIELLEGKMYIDSIKGEGSCFTICIPIERNTEILQIPSMEENKPTNSFEEIPSLKILLVDDDNIQLEMTAALLSKFGHHIETTIHPNSVSKKIETNDFDLIITDIQMPEMSGFDLIKEIRNSSIEKICSCRVIAVSGREDIPEVDYLKAGFNGFLNKPFTPAQLNNIINRIAGLNTIEKIDNTENIPSDKSNNKPYTLNNIRSFTDGDENVLQKIIETFLEETNQNLSLLEKYIKNRQYVPVQQISHRMLPMFRHIKAQNMIEILSVLEKTDIVEENHQLFYKFTKKAINEGKKILHLIREDIRTI